MKRNIFAIIFLLLGFNVFSSDFKFIYPGTSLDTAKIKLEDVSSILLETEDKCMFGVHYTMNYRYSDYLAVHVILTLSDNTVTKSYYSFNLWDEYEDFSKLILDLLKNEEIKPDIMTDEKYEGRGKNGFLYTINVHKEVLSINIEK